MSSQAQKNVPSTAKSKKKQAQPDKFIPIAHFKAYLDKNSHVRVDFSRKPISPGDFTCLFMGVMEAYTELLLHNNGRKEVYTHFNNAFGIFLRKLLPESEIYKTSAEHKKLKEITDETLLKPQDPYLSETNKLAAYVLAKEILKEEVGLTEESIDLILNRRLGLLPKDIIRTKRYEAPNAEKVEKGK